MEMYALQFIEQRKMRQSYYAATSYTDSLVGQLLHTLDQLGLAKNTIISLHGDHGMYYGMSWIPAPNSLDHITISMTFC